MTQQQEKLSAFMDGEIEGNDIIDAIKQDEALQAKWQRYHVYRGAMRKEASVAPQLDITASVAAALENEPAIVAPKRSRWQSIPLIGNVVPFAKQSEPFMTAPTIAPQGGLSPVSLEQTRTLPRNDMNEMLEKKRKINALIADHEQQIKLKQAQEDEGESETSGPERP